MTCEAASIARPLRPPQSRPGTTEPRSAEPTTTVAPTSASHASPKETEMDEAAAAAVLRGTGPSRFLPDHCGLGAGLLGKAGVERNAC